MASNTDQQNQKARSLTYRLTLYALFAALLCIFAPMSVPIGPIPISLTGLVLYFTIFILETKGTLVSYTVYLLLGMVGLPVFSGYSGGLGKLAGPTGGYLIGYLPAILIMGLAPSFARKKSRAIDLSVTFVGMIVGTAIAYLFGTIWFVIQMGCAVSYALSVCVFPFIPFDIGKMVIATVLGRKVRSLLARQGLVAA